MIPSTTVDVFTILLINFSKSACSIPSWACPLNHEDQRHHTEMRNLWFWILKISIRLMCYVTKIVGFSYVSLSYCFIYTFFIWTMFSQRNRVIWKAFYIVKEFRIAVRCIKCYSAFLLFVLQLQPTLKFCREHITPSLNETTSSNLSLNRRPSPSHNANNHTIPVFAFVQVESTFTTSNNKKFLLHYLCMLQQ